jgi:sialic acid synthase SpsE
LEPGEFSKLANSILLVKQCLGDETWGTNNYEDESRRFRRSLFIVKDIKKGATATNENVKSIRPAGGLLPKELQKVIGLTFNQDLKAGTPLSWHFFSNLT